MTQPSLANAEGRGLMHHTRRLVGGWIFHLGFKIMPPNIQRGLACIFALGIVWAKNDEATFLKVMSGELSIEWQWTSTTNPDAGAS